MTHQKKYTIMVVDNNLNDVNYLRDVLAKKPYKIFHISDGEEGFKLLLQDPETYSAIILGQNIDQINGLKLLYRINSSSTIKSIPVIIEAATGSFEEIDICIRAGARYCIPKPFEEKIMPQILATAIRDQTRYTETEQAALNTKPLGTLIKAEFKIKTLKDAQHIGNLLAGECPNPRLAAVGITEMLINAIEHGNLGINYAEKTKLHEKEEWLSEIDRRLAHPVNADKFVQVIFDKSDSHINIRITDQGEGFNWREYQTLDNKRVFDNHGRGIVMARSLTFESLIYHDKGNDVECIIPLGAVDNSL